MDSKLRWQLSKAQRTQNQGSLSSGWRRQNHDHGHGHGLLVVVRVCVRVHGSRSSWSCRRGRHRTSSRGMMSTSVVAGTQGVMKSRLSIRRRMPADPAHSPLNFQRAQSTKHKAQSTKHKAQSTKHKAQSTKHKARTQNTKHKAHTKHTQSTQGTLTPFLPYLAQSLCVCSVCFARRNVSSLFHDR